MTRTKAYTFLLESYQISTRAEGSRVPWSAAHVSPRPPLLPAVLFHSTPSVCLRTPSQLEAQFNGTSEKHCLAWAPLPEPGLAWFSLAWTLPDRVGFSSIPIIHSSISIQRVKYFTILYSDSLTLCSFSLYIVNSLNKMKPYSSLYFQYSTKPTTQNVFSK